MKRALSCVTVTDLIFILLLSVSAFFGGLAGNVIYYSAFLLPFLIAIYVKNKTKSEFNPPRIRCDGISLLIPVIAPTLVIVFLISWLTSLLLSSVGGGNYVDVSGNIFIVILKHAVVPAIAEEALFRYIPIAFISPYTKRGAVLISALFFGLVHCNLYQLPYALFAGVIFAAADIAFDSILPSVMLHFINNLSSVFWQRYGGSATFSNIYLIALIAFVLVSLVFVFVFRKKYKDIISPIICDKRKYKLSYESIIFIVLTLFVAVTNLI